MKYAVIILNYKTHKDVIQAVKCVYENAEDSFGIVIVDNDSDEDQYLIQLQNDKTKILFLHENMGYARGNNKGAEHVLSLWNPKYLVFMNPDVLIDKKGTIENTIQEAEKHCAIGGQPLVNTIGNNWPPNKQVNIRRVRNYSDILVSSSIILKSIFRRKFERTIYGEKMPYNNCVRYEVPSGAFFIIEAKCFKDVGGFDERTFLYNEEEILGYKLKKRNQFFVLNPNYIVRHMQGISTGAHGGIINRFSMKCERDSLNIYMREYLRCGWIKVIGVNLLTYVDPFFQKIVLDIKKIVKKFRCE